MEDNVVTTEEAGQVEVDFGQGRLLEAQLALRSVLGRVEREPFGGCRLRSGELIREFEDADAAAMHYGQGLLDFLKGLGAEVSVLADVAAQVDVQKAAVRLDALTENAAPFDLLVVCASVPGNALGAPKRVAAGIVEACAEIVRALLGTAVVAAAEDAAADEGVVCLFRNMPEIAGKVSFETGKMVGLVRVHAVVYTAREPRVSYVLGNCLGQLKPRQFVYELPLVEQFYGPNRLRWMDLRSPGYDLEQKAEAGKVVVS